MAPRKKAEDSASLAVKHYRAWSTAREVVKEGNDDLGIAVKQAIEALNCSKWAFKQAAELRRMKETKACARIKELKQLCQDLGLTDENFKPVQGDIEDVIASTEAEV